MASALRSVTACTPEMRRERRQLPDKLWINMGAYSEHPNSSGQAVGSYITDNSPFLIVVEVDPSMALL